MNDFEKEHQLFTYNYRLSNKKVDTIFLCAELENLFTSSSTVKEVVFLMEIHLLMFLKLFIKPF